MGGGGGGGGGGGEMKKKERINILLSSISKRMYFNATTFPVLRSLAL